MIYVTGDLHGKHDAWKLLPEAWPQGQGLTCDDYLIIAGDAGMWWQNPRINASIRAWLDEQPWTTLFVDGNHEGFDALLSLPREQWHGGDTSVLPGTRVRWLRRGQVFDLEGQRILTMGGATSVDRHFRTPGFDWFEEELPSEDELDACRAVLDACGWSVDYVITHTCGSSLLGRALYPQPGWQAPETDRLTAFLDELDARLSYRHWYFGHMHNDRTMDDRHTLLYQRIVMLGHSLDDAGERVSEAAS